MKLEDYNKYYIQGSDHYLIPSDIFEELFDEMINWKKEAKEISEQHREINGELRKQIKSYETLVNDYINKYDDLSIRIDKAIEYIEKTEEKNFGFNYEYGLTTEEIKKLLKILKGEE